MNKKEQLRGRLIGLVQEFEKHSKEYDRTLSSLTKSKLDYIVQQFEQNEKALNWILNSELEGFSPDLEDCVVPCQCHGQFDAGLRDDCKCHTRP